MTSPLIEVDTPYGTLSVPEEPEGHTLHNAGPAGVALLYNVRTGQERHADVAGGTPSSPARYELASSDERFIGWVTRG